MREFVRPRVTTLVQLLGRAVREGLHADRLRGLPLYHRPHSDIAHADRRLSTDPDVGVGRDTRSAEDCHDVNADAVVFAVLVFQDRGLADLERHAVAVFDVGCFPEERDDLVVSKDFVGVDVDVGGRSVQVEEFGREMVCGAALEAQVAALFVCPKTNAEAFLSVFLEHLVHVLLPRLRASLDLRRYSLSDWYVQHDIFLPRSIP